MTPLTRVRRSTLLLPIALALAGCELVGDVFQAGFIAGLVVVLLVVALIVWFMQRHKS